MRRANVVATGLLLILPVGFLRGGAAYAEEKGQSPPAWERTWDDPKIDASIRSLLGTVSTERMRKHLFHLSKDPLPYRKLNYTLPGHAKNTLYEADDYLAAQLESWGYRVQREGVSVQAYRCDRSKPKQAQYSPPKPEDPRYTAYNLYAEKRGRVRPEEIVVVLAHKDSQSWVDSPGANDNAIGTVGVLELACAVAQIAPECTVRFLFCNEEHTPWTSVTAAENAKARGDRIVAVFNLDGIGAKGADETAAHKKTNVTAFTAPEGERLAELISAVNVHFAIGLEQRAAKRARPGDDDGSFVKAGYPAAVVNIGSWPYADPNYHAEGDIPERCDLENAALTVRATLAAVLTVAVAPPARPAEVGRTDLPRFLPNDGNSVYPVKGLLRQWPAGGPKRLWQVEVGYGKSAVVESGGLAFTAAESDDKQWALCLDPATGATRWKHLLLPKKNRHYEWGTVTSPVVDGDRVYFIPYAIDKSDVWEMRCPIVCLKTDGTELWRADESFWATEASTPLVVGDTLYVGADNPERVVLVALDKMTGKLRWSVKAESDKDRELAASASLTYQVVEGIPQVIVGTYGTREVLGVHALTGEIMWRYPYPADIILGLISTPVAAGSRLFLSAGEGKGRNFSACLEMQAAGGKITCREAYHSTELQTNTYNTVAIDQDAVFGFGGGSKAGFLHCTNLADGRLLWREAGRIWTCEQNLVIADGLLFALTKNDELVMAEASRERYRELGRMPLHMELGRPQQPTIANGRMYIRGSKEVACYRIAE
jgi:outer membrane protein assembly factor BamB